MGENYGLYLPALCRKLLKNSNLNTCGTRFIIFTFFPEIVPKFSPIFFNIVGQIFKKIFLQNLLLSKMPFMWSFVDHLLLNVTRCFIDWSVQRLLGHTPQILPLNTLSVGFMYVMQMHFFLNHKAYWALMFCISWPSDASLCSSAR